MSKTAIRVQGLGKQYRIGATKARADYSTLRDSISNSISGLFRKKDGNGSAQGSRFWALRDIDFTVNEGEILGVIGRNGSGKSTLLKILSDIVEPTEGRAEIQGRVASLLEVGTGFHGELTGRENVFLNGAILGMSQSDVRRNFDKIVEFSGIGQFIDTPVKRYSSGMYTRLAFSVAAYLEPEVLVVDEVLAVGDFEFQQRCIGRMREVGRDGRTVLFVSHNMSAVESLCTRCVYLESGRLILEGEPYDITREYRRRMAIMDGNKLADLDKVEGAERAVRVFKSAYLVDERGELTSAIGVSRSFEVRIGVDIPPDLSNLIFIVRIDNVYGERILTLRSPLKDTEYLDLSGEHEIACRVDEFPVAPGSYRIGLALQTRNRNIDSINDVLSLTVTDGDLFDEGQGALAGKCVSRSQWSILPPSELGLGETETPIREARAPATGSVA
jgi:lipopolysaccharide transport system ATP-binding protein